MNLVNTYLLLPLQRKIFKNFGHYDYQTSTFHLNEERVNEVLFDPSYNPFVDVLRETAHASAVASSKASFPRQPSPTPKNPTGEASPSRAPHAEQSAQAAPTRTGAQEESANGAPELCLRQPCVQLLHGKVRSAGLVSFLRQVTTQKSLAVESIHLIFSVAAGSGATSTGAPTQNTTLASSTSPFASTHVRDDDDDDDDKTSDEEAVSSPSEASAAASQDLHVDPAALTLAHSYSLEDHSSLLRQRSKASRASAQAAEGTPAAPASPAPSAFHTVGDLMSYLKQQLQGITVGVEEVHLTFCVPGVGTECVLAEAADGVAGTAKGSRGSFTATPRVRCGTRLLHFSCRRGLRLSVDEAAAGTAKEDMQCSAVVNDWQCYLHVMAEDGPVPSVFSLDELVMTTTANVGSSAGDTEAASAPPPTTRAETTSSPVAPIIVHLARRSAVVVPPTNTGAPPATPITVPKIVLDVEATGGWSVVLTAAQVAHMGDMVQRVTSALSATPSDPLVVSAEEEGQNTSSSTTTTTPSPSLSARWSPALAEALLEKAVDAAPLESGEAVTAAALAASQLRSAAKYVCLHSAGCSVTLLTQAVVPAGVVARAWCSALPAPQRALLSNSESGKDGADATVPLQPVFKALASPHFTYVMRDVDVLFPNVESGTSTTPSLCRAFEQDRKKRTIYRNLFKNNLVDASVTEQLAQARQWRLHEECRSVFLGIRSVELVEYRQAAGKMLSAPVSQLHSRGRRVVRPARLLHAERVPYALVVFHRTTEPLPEKTDRHRRAATTTSAAADDASAASTEPRRWCRHQETIVVGLASISMQLDPDVFNVLTTYAITLAELTRSFEDSSTGRAKAKRNSQPSAPYNEAPLSKAIPLQQDASSVLDEPSVHTRSSIKVLLESLEASVRFPLSSSTPDALFSPGSENHNAPPSSSSPPLPSLLARLLQRLRDTSLHTYRRVHAELQRRARFSSRSVDAVGSRQQEQFASEAPVTGVVKPRVSLTTGAESDTVHQLRSTQEKLGFPEDTHGHARFLPELLRFSVRDLQLVQAHSPTDDVTAAGAAAGPGCASTEANVAAPPPPPPPSCASIKWREAVVYMQDVLEKTTSELLRINYSPEMTIRVTHAGLPDGTLGGRWRALSRVLLLQIRLGEVTTTVLTQDDYLLASYFLQEMLRMFTLCRQRLHAVFGEEDAAAVSGSVKAHAKVTAAAAPADAAPSISREGDAATSAARDSAAPSATTDTSSTHDGDMAAVMELPSFDSASGTVAEAFAIADAHRRASSTTQFRSREQEHQQQQQLSLRATESADIDGAATQGQSDANQDLLDSIPDLWCYLESTCTALDVHIGRVRLGLFAPRLSPMGNVVGEPLLRCLPLAQRRQLVDLACLYHTYLVEVGGVSLRGLLGNGGLLGKGQEAFFAVRVGDVALWECQPLALPGGSGAWRDRGASPSSLYSSYVSGVVQSGHAASPGSLHASSSAGEGAASRSSPLRESHDASTTAHNAAAAAAARRDFSYYWSHKQHRASTLVQLIESYTESSDGGVVDKDEAVSGRANEQFLRDLWNSYVVARRDTFSEGGGAVDAGAYGNASSEVESFVCKMRFLEHTPGASDDSHILSCRRRSTTAQQTSMARADACPMRHIRVQLTRLGLHHVVSYNGDHLAATLKNFFSGGDSTVAATAETAPDLHHPTSEPAALGRSGQSDSTFTEVHLELKNLMATYRPRGVGCSIAVALLPRVSVVVTVPADTTPSTAADAIAGGGGGVSNTPRDENGERGGRENELALARSTAAVQAQAWLHTSLPIYVCNDCDVEALAREVLDLTESDDWGADLEGAGFVRLCEVVSTAPAESSSSTNPAVTTTPSPPPPPPPCVAGIRCRSGNDTSSDSTTGASLPQRPRRPNLVMTLPQADGALDNGSGGGASAALQDPEREAVADSQPAVSVRVCHVELSAFMAKDAFDVLRELVDTWAAGTDLLATDTPAALVMRSGPGFEWVAEEVARSCAPMTFRLNPSLAHTELSREAGDDGSRDDMQPTASVGDFSHYAASSHPLFASYMRDVYHDAAASGGEGGGGGAASTSFSGTTTRLPGYTYHSWRDALYAAQGEDQQLAEAYQTRMAALLDPSAAWVPARRATPPAAPNGNSNAEGKTAQNALTSAQVRKEFHEAMSISSFEDDPYERDDAADLHGKPAVPLSSPSFAGVTTKQPASTSPFVHATSPSPVPPAVSPFPPHSASSVSSSFSDLSDLETTLAPLQWHRVPTTDPNTAFSETARRISAAVLVQRAANVTVEEDTDGDGDDDFDLCAACERQPYFLSCWSRDRHAATAQSSIVHLNHLERTDDALLHDGTEKYLYPPVQLQLYLSDCAVNVSLYEGTDLMAAAVRRQRRGYLQIVSRGARVAQAAPYSLESNNLNGQRQRNVAHADAPLHATGRVAAQTPDPPGDGAAANAESSASRLCRLNSRGCRSGFGDRDASKRLVLSCRGITVQLDTFPQAAEEDLWFHVVVGEVTVFDCIETSNVHRLLTATPPASSVPASARATTATTATATSPAYVNRGVGTKSPGPPPERDRLADAAHTDGRQLELTGLLTSSKSVHMASHHDVADDSRASFTVSHFQQGGSELSLVVRLQPTSLTWSGASVDFAQSFFVSTSSTSTAPPPTTTTTTTRGNTKNATANAGGSAAVADGVRPAAGAGDVAGKKGGLSSAAGGSSTAAATAAEQGSRAAADGGVISGTEAPPIFFRRIVILPTTLTIAGSFQSDKGVIAALAEGKSLDALRSVPVLSWISLQEIPLPIPFMRIEDCSSAVTLLQRIVEDSNCVSVRFLLTAFCCGLQPLSAVARVGEAAKGLLLLPLSQYRGAALHHAIRTASSVFMQELLTQTSGMAALLASGSYHASRSLLELLVTPSERRLGIAAEPSRAAQPAGLAEGWKQGQEQLRTGLEEALTMASYCTGPDGSLLRLPAAALRVLMGFSGAATTTLWGVRNSQDSAARDRDGFIYKK